MTIGQHEHCLCLRADVKNRRGQGAARGRKITGLQFLPGDPSQLLITSNDSRIRLYDGARRPAAAHACSSVPRMRRLSGLLPSPLLLYGGHMPSFADSDIMLSAENCPVQAWGNTYYGVRDIWQLTQQQLSCE